MNWQFVLAEKWDLVFDRSNKQFGRKSDYCYLDSMGFVRVMPSSTLFSLQAPVTHSLNIITFENFALSMLFGSNGIKRCYDDKYQCPPENFSNTSLVECEFHVY